MDVVKEDRGVRPETANGLQRGLGVQGVDATDQRRYALTTLRHRSVALGTEAGKDLFPLLDRAAPWRQPGSVRGDVDVPAGDLLSRRRATKAELAVRRRHRRPPHRQR